uniref:TGF_BETA_2 domain-containing protein n=1 Tax=Elaeophora elaphi TaxID=1147741 RepID=A0A0R3RK23_9BILA
MIEQCPCVKPPGSSECLSYDSRLQAANIDEALHTFPDLSSLTEAALPLVVSDENTVMMKFTSGFLLSQKMIHKTPKMYKCDEKECKACKLLITNAFHQATESNFPIASRTILQLSDGADDESFCTRNRSTPRNSVNDGIENATTIKELPAYMEEFISLLKPKIRKRRTWKESKQKLLGVAITISCNYKKGEEIAQGWTGLCNLCWQWRKLPADYFPVLLNEVACDMSDEGCLAGFGNCRPVMRTINVLRNVGTKKSPRWMQESINTVSACECQVEVGTPLHSLVLR